MRNSARIFPAIVISALLIVFASVPVRADEEGHFDRTLTVTGAVNLDVQTGSGNIDVHPGGSGSVEIHAKIRASGWHMGGDIEQRIHQIETNPPIEQNGNTIRIGHSDDRDLYRDISISYDLPVPATNASRELAVPRMPPAAPASCNSRISVQRHMPDPDRAMSSLRPYTAT